VTVAVENGMGAVGEKKTIRVVLASHQFLAARRLLPSIRVFISSRKQCNGIRE
jgi:hypothetical protein